MGTVLKVALGVLLGGGLLIGAVFGVVALTEESEDASDRAAEIQRRIDAQEAQQADTPAEVPAGEPSAEDAPLEDGGETTKLGEAARSGGIKLTVVRATEAPSLRYTDDTGKARTKKAKQGGSYVSVKTRITNDTSRGIDLTCSFEVDGKIVDDSGREFDPIDELYSVPGNPECNDMLQPGFKENMTWVYLVPDADEVSSFQFSDVTDLDAEHAPAEVALRSG